MYDGTYLVSNYPMIVITANYRLGALGFLVVGNITGYGTVQGRGQSLFSHLIACE
jgi:carboxylesterase type B